MKAGHETIFEHIDVVFHIDGISRSLLQQWSRHRLQSQNVKSTRYTIDKMIKEFVSQYQRIGYVEQQLIDNYFVRFPYSQAIINEITRQISIDGWDLNKANNDILKYCFPEALKTETISKMNLRSFINLYKLRSSNHAIKEFRDLSFELYVLLPDYVKELVDISCGKNEL
jgi:flavin-dependent thymidylate synthase